MVEAALRSRLVQKLYLSISYQEGKEFTFHFICKYLNFPRLENFFLFKPQGKKILFKKSICCIDTAFLGKDERTNPGKITVSSITFLEGT